MGPVPTRAAELLPTAPIETPLEIVLNRYCIRATVPAPVVDRLTVRAELWLDRIGQTVQRIAREHPIAALTTVGVVALVLGGFDD